MKCIINKDNYITRVSDDEAAAKVAAGTHLYAKKEAWKKQERVVVEVIRPAEPVVVAGKHKRAAKPKKEKRRA